MKIIFMGTPDFAVPALEMLIDEGHEILAVYTQPPRPKGRGQHVQPSPVQLVAERHKIPVYTPKSLKRDEGAQLQFVAHRAENGFDVGCIAFDIRNHHQDIARFQARQPFEQLQQVVVKHFDFASGAVAGMELDGSIPQQLENYSARGSDFKTSTLPCTPAPMASQTTWEPCSKRPAG